MQAALNQELAQQRATLDRQRQALEGRQSGIAPVEFQRQLGLLGERAQTLDQ